MQISPRVLISFYLIIPLICLLTLCDYVFLENWILTNTSLNPSDLPYFPFFFGTPHIVTSAALFLDNSYLPKLKLQLTLILIASVTIFLILDSLSNQELANSIFFLWTYWHLTKQQTGISKNLLGLKSLYIMAWDISLPLLIMFFFYWKDSLSSQVCQIVAVFLCFFSVVQFYIFKKRDLNTWGNLHLLSTNLLIANLFFLSSFGYSMFGFLCLRIVHDCTAFYFYICHNKNKTKIEPTSLIFANSFVRRFNSTWSTPAIGVLLSIPFVYFGFTTIPAYFHYLTEQFSWKSNSLLRRHIRFSS